MMEIKRGKNGAPDIVTFRPPAPRMLPRKEEEVEWIIRDGRKMVLYKENNKFSSIGPTGPWARLRVQCRCLRNIGLYRWKRGDEN